MPGLPASGWGRGGQPPMAVWQPLMAVWHPQLLGGGGPSSLSCRGDGEVMPGGVGPMGHHLPIMVLCPHSATGGGLILP